LFLLTKVQYPVKFKIQPLDKEEQYYIIAIDMKGDNSQESVEIQTHTKSVCISKHLTFTITLYTYMNNSKLNKLHLKIHIKHFGIKRNITTIFEFTTLRLCHTNFRDFDCI
jgi:hypothetical protein